jgi:hypothetical protein
MTEPAAQLDATTHDADARDKALLDAVIHRLESAEGTILDPAHEARVMRALAATWRGPVAPSVGLRVYREVLGAALRRHRPVSLHVADKDRDVAELARAHFGFAIPMTIYPTSSMVVQALVDDRNAIGVVPAPLSDDGQAGWWSNLSPATGTGPRIVAKLPFFQGDGSIVRHPVSYALASVPVTASGDDTTLIAVFLRGELSRSRLGQVLKATTLDAQVIAMGHDQPERAARRFLVEAAGFVQVNDSRLNALRAHGGDEIADVTIVGAYANPVIFGGAKS